MSLIDPTVRRYGHVVIGSGAIVECHVVLGHPPAARVLAALPAMGTERTLSQFYNRVSDADTIIGPDAIIRSGSVIYGGVTIGARFDCGHNVIVREGTRIAEGVYLKNNTEIMTSVTIGSGSRVAGVIADGVVLGDRVSCFGAVTHTYRAHVDPVRNLDDPYVLPRTTAAPTISDGVIIGRGAVIVGGVTVGAGARIGSNAVVQADVPAGGRVLAPKSC